VSRCTKWKSFFPTINYDTGVSKQIVVPVQYFGDLFDIFQDDVLATPTIAYG
jgi:hypothetical protein